jgi:RNA polymerase sigma-70 factor (ECF subfamily)
MCSVDGEDDQVTLASAADRELEHVVRDEAGLLVARIYRRIGDLDVAEEAVADAVVEALTAWRRDGLPARPAAWLATAARHNALDRVRRAARYRDRLAVIAAELDAEPPPAVTGQDDRLALIFGCCHPALSRPAQLALTLRAVVGLTTAEIARATFTRETAIAQRIVRAKRKIGQAGIPVRIPPPAELPERLDAVLTVVYLAYNEAFLTTSGPDPQRRDLAADAEWLARTLRDALPTEPEVLGLLALLRLHQARAATRFDRAGRLVLLADQDRARWDRTAITEAVGLITAAARLRRPGRFQLQAAIAACHAEAPTWAETDWLQILTLYDLLVRHDGSPVVRLNQAIALAHVSGAAAALSALEPLAAPLADYHLFHATRAHLLRGLGRTAEARAADERALGLTGNVAERELLADRLEHTVT